MSNNVAAVLGSTGQVGNQVLRHALASNAFSSVHECGRRAAELPEGTSGVEKRTSHTINLDAPDATALSGLKANAVLIALGTTRKNAGSAEAFKKIDQDYVVEFAKASRADGTEQRVLYCSAGGSSLSSPFLYPKSKAQTEQRLSQLGYTETIIFKPGFLAGTARSEGRIAESIFGAVTSFGSRFSNSLEIDVRDLGLAIVKASVLGVAGLQKAGIGAEQSFGETKTWTVSNADALKLAKLET